MERIIDIHSDYKIPFFDDAVYRYGYDDGYMNNMTAKAVRELETKYPDRKNSKTLLKLNDIKGAAFLDESGKINLNGLVLRSTSLI